MTLSILIWLPLAISVVAMFLRGRAAGWWTAVLSLATLGIAVDFLCRFHSGVPGPQFVTDHIWIGALGIHYALALTGLNLVLVVLTTVLFSAAMFWSAFRQVARPRVYYFWLCAAESTVLGAFCAQDLILFVGFFDVMLIPFYFLIGTWGTGEHRVRATIKMVIYTACGSFLMLAAAIAAGVIAAGEHDTALNFTYAAMRTMPLSHTSQDWLFLCFGAAFLIKMPLVPFHGWLSDAYASMPIAPLAAFSGVVAKVASYGFLAIVLPLFPDASVHFQMLMLIIALASILWATAMAFTTRNIRLVIAYSSVAYMGFILLGIFSLSNQGGQGALLQMLNHGVVTAALFFVIAALAARAGGSENLDDLGGIAVRAPILAALFIIVTFANLAMPGSSNFVGEFLILLGTFNAKLPISVIAFLGVIGASYYALRLFVGTMHKRVGPRVATHEIVVAEAVAIVPLVLITLALAFYPQFALHRSEASLGASVTATSVHARTVAAAPVMAGLRQEGGN